MSVGRGAGHPHQYPGLKTKVKVAAPKTLQNAGKFDQ